jgi:hypothetical protein
LLFEAIACHQDKTCAIEEIRLREIIILVLKILITTNDMLEQAQVLST